MAEPLLANTEPEPDCLCGHPKFEHRLGKKGCRNMDCVFGCDRYTPQDPAPQPKPIDLDAVIAVAEPADEPPAAEESAPAPAPAPAAADPEPAQPDPTVDAEAEAAALAAQLEQVQLRLADSERDRNHAQRLVSDAWDALAEPAAVNLSAGIIALRKDRDAAARERDVAVRDRDAFMKDRDAAAADAAVRGERLVAALDRADAADARILLLEAGSADLLLARAQAYDLERVSFAAAAARVEIGRLREVVETADDELAIRSKIGELEKSLGAARVELQALVGVAGDGVPDQAVDAEKPPWWPLPAPAGVIRRWCHDNEVVVNATGTPSKAAIAEYVAAHPAAADA